jgi:hypothetical protein
MGPNLGKPKADVKKEVAGPMTPIVGVLAVAVLD